MFGGPNPNAWNNWYHAVGSTHGVWLRGDPRGFRTFRHRLHVEGDYRNPPPPGVFAPMFERSKRRLKHPPVRLPPRQRGIVCRAMVERLRKDGAEVVALAVMPEHFHLLARFQALDGKTLDRYRGALLSDGRDPAPRHFLGLARKHASHVLREKALKPVGAVWGKRPKFDPVRDRRHQVNTARYAREHVHQGAAVYCIGEGFMMPAEVEER